MIRDSATTDANNDDSESIDGLYLIKSGAAKVTKSSENGQVEAVVAILREGNWFGEIGLIDGLPPSANVTAMQPMKCFFLPRNAFLEALNENPEIAVSMLPGLGSMVTVAVVLEKVLCYLQLVHAVTGGWRLIDYDLIDRIAVEMGFYQIEEATEFSCFVDDLSLALQGL